MRLCACDHFRAVALIEHPLRQQEEPESHVPVVEATYAPLISIADPDEYLAAVERVPRIPHDPEFGFSRLVSC